MLIRFNKKTRDDIVAIFTFINEYQGVLDEIDFFQFLISYEYYPVYYQNYHIFRNLIEYHNSHLKKENKKDVIYDDSSDLLDMLQF